MTSNELKTNVSLGIKTSFDPNVKIHILAISDTKCGMCQWIPYGKNQYKGKGYHLADRIRSSGFQDS